MPSTDDSPIQCDFDFVDPRWLVEHDKSATGQMLQRTAGRRLVASKSLNPWARLSEDSKLPDNLKVFLGAGASAWNAMSKLMRIRTGADTPTRDSLENLRKSSTRKNRRQFFSTS